MSISAGALGAATPTTVPAWVDINAQIPARTDMSSDTVAFNYRNVERTLTDFLTLRREFARLL